MGTRSADKYASVGIPLRACKTTSSLGASIGVSMIVSSSRFGSSERIFELKYWYPVRFLRLRSTHQIKFVVKPPNRTTTSLGRPDQSCLVPALTEASLIGLPAVSP